MKKILFILVTGIIGYIYYPYVIYSVEEYLENTPSIITENSPPTIIPSNNDNALLSDTYNELKPSDNNQIILEAYNNHRSNIQVTSSGIVSRILRDDIEGKRHQKFIIRLPTNQTLLIAHNIDLAPRIKSLNIGDEVTFYGEYAWNVKGGVIHWTHHDPRGYHVGGWLEHNGKKYQ